MSREPTVLEHLLEGREALVREIERLTGARAELDAVIARIRGAEVDSASVSPQPVTAGTATSPTGVGRPASQRHRSPAKKSVRRSAARGSTAPKSIRVHVLEMLGSEDREFGLAEIIDRIRAEGIQAHDDAVRSITIKLMKDGSVQRVGRGQYRLASRTGIDASAPPTPPAATDPAAETVPAATGRDGDGFPAPENAGAATSPPPLNLSQPWSPPQG
jgi:hypothetical protein